MSVYFMTLYICQDINLRIQGMFTFKKQFREAFTFGAMHQ